MGLERFHGESAPNAEMKCLCTIVVDVSGTMKPCIGELNEALRNFFKDIEYGNGVPESTKEQLEVCVIAFDQDVMFKRNPSLLDQGEMPPRLVTRGSTTESVAALEAAIQMTNDRKEFYKETGQPYYRPWIVFMTDGEPNPYDEAKIADLEARIKQDAKNRSYYIQGLGVGSQISERTIKRLTAGNAQQLKGTNFGAFFKWLSNSMSIIVSSKPGQKVDISGGQSEWMKPFDSFEI